MRKNLLVFFFFFLTFLCAGQSFTAIDSLKKVIRNTEQDTIRVLALRELSLAYRYFEIDSSLIIGQQALKLSEKIKYPRGQSQSYQALAGGYRVLGDLPKAWENSNKAVEIATKNNLYYEQASAFNMLGIIYGQIGDKEKELKFYKKAFAVNQKSPPIHYKRRLEIALLNNIGICFLDERKQADSAYYYLKQAAEAYAEFPIGGVVALNKLGRAEFNMGQREQGFSHMRKALQESRKNHNPTGELGAHSDLAEVFLELHQFDSAFVHAKRSLALAKTLKTPIEINSNAKLLAKLLDTVDIKQAYFYQKLADSVNNVLNGSEQNAKIQRLMLEELERQTLERIDREAEEARFKQFIFAGAIVLLLLVIGILFRSVKKEKKAKLLLEAKNKEIQATQSQLIQSEKMASLGELTAGIAHEIQNPLNFVNNFSEVSNELIDEMNVELERGDVSEAKAIAKDVKQNLEKINHHGKRADAIVKGMLQHSRTSSGQKELTDINALCDEYLRLAYHGLRAKDKSFNAKFETDFDSSLPKVSVIPQDIGRVILNLINNAFYAVNERFRQSRLLSGQPDSGFEPLVKVVTKSLGDKIKIRVIDNGNGIPDSIKGKIFQPFFTTKPTGQGTGLGLSLAYDIVKTHNGKLKVETKEGEGSEFVIVLII